jgi:hypothetical protein
LVRCWVTAVLSASEFTCRSCPPHPAKARARALRATGRRDLTSSRLLLERAERRRFIGIAAHGQHGWVLPLGLDEMPG